VGWFDLADEVEPSLGDGRFLDVAQFLAQSKNEAAVQEKIAGILRRDRHPPGNLHQRIVELPLAGIVTTNYDLLLSDADRERRYSRPASPRTSSLSSQLQRARLRPFATAPQRGLAPDLSSVLLSDT
jgi:hypothetical protein